MKFLIIIFILCVPFPSFAEEIMAIEPFTIDEKLQHKSSLPISLIILEKKAHSGDADAQFEAGLFYFKGITIEKDLTKSLHYFSLAAEQNHPKALYNLGTLYIDGSLVDKDTEKGLTFLKRAVDTNYVPAQVAYAFLYIDGEILPQNMEKAYEWISIAHKNKDISNEDRIELEKYKKNLEIQITPEQKHAVEERLKHKF
ncbi:MAG: tetratricopeptide repeat protein [Desulfovibrionaceae bacterium]